MLDEVSPFLHELNRRVPLCLRFSFSPLLFWLEHERMFRFALQHPTNSIYRAMANAEDTATPAPQPLAGPQDVNAEIIRK